MEIAVAGAARHEEVVGLRRLNAAEARSATLDVDDKRGKIGAREVGYSPVELTKPEECIGCASCAMMCPDCVITVER